MRAAVLWELNKDLEVRDDLEVVELGPSDVRIQLVASGVCRSDVSAQNGTIPVALPCVLGHEGAGVVREVGEGVTELRAGDHAILSFLRRAASARACLRGQSYLCEEMLSMLTASHFGIGNGAWRASWAAEPSPKRWSSPKTR